MNTVQLKFYKLELEYSKSDIYKGKFNILSWIHLILLKYIITCFRCICLERFLGSLWVFEVAQYDIA